MACGVEWQVVSCRPGLLTVAEAAVAFASERRSGGGSGDAYPVSVKGVAARDGRILLLQNERGEWELPGGRLEIGETPEQCVVREIAEETKWTVTAGPILDAWPHHITQAGKHVLIVTYACLLKPGQGVQDPVLSAEHQRIGLFTPGEITGLAMPRGYKDSIATWRTQHARHIGEGNEVECAAQDDGTGTVVGYVSISSDQARFFTAELPAGERPAGS